MLLRSIFDGIKIIAMLIIRPKFAVTEPTAFPTAMSGIHLYAAIEETTSSGSVVARLTIVAPMMNFGIPDISAIHVAASTKKSPPFIIIINPNANIEIVKIYSTVILRFFSCIKLI